ncbi:MAG: hypothetical protein H0V12_02475 [Chloroflexi bacterium]|nr:hypothetical protein [Chloroflexota bacterium]
MGRFAGRFAPTGPLVGLLDTGQPVFAEVPAPRQAEGHSGRLRTFALNQRDEGAGRRYQTTRGLFVA